MNTPDLPILRATADAVHEATPEQLPLQDIPLWARVCRRLPDGAVVQLGDVRDAARHLAVVGIVRRDGGGWSPGPVSPRDAPVETHHERMFWTARRRRVAEGRS